MLTANVKIDLRNVLGVVHDDLFGANLEHVGQSVYGGVWAEMLQDRKFAGADLMRSEGLDHQHPFFGVVAPWAPIHPDRDAVLFVHDNTTFYTGRQSQRIDVLQDDGRSHGVQQGGLYLQSGQGYEVRVVLRGSTGPVRITLGDATWTVSVADDRWTTFSRTLVPARSDPAGRLAIECFGLGRLWIGAASVMPDDHAEGFRRDVVEAIREWTPTWLRWPGGNVVSAYHWDQGVGPPDLRPSYLDPAWSLIEPNDVGTDEFMALCRLIGSKPVLTVNMGDGTAAEAAAWVAYCNAPADTEGGARRAANGHVAPYGVRTWYVGNEQFGNWQVGHVDAETYARRYLEFARAMRAVDPNLTLIAVGAPTDLYGRWNELVLRDAATELDALSVHYYSIRTEKLASPPTNEELCLPKSASAHEVASMLDATIEGIARHAPRPVPLVFDEWNTYVRAKAPSFIEEYDVADALYAAGVMNACLRRCDAVTGAAIFNLVNVMGNYMVGPLRDWTWHPSRGNYWVARADGEVAPPSVWKTPTTLVLELLTHHRGRHVVAATVDTPTYDSPPMGSLPALRDVPVVDVAATFAADAAAVFLSLVNRDVERSATVHIEGLVRRGEATAHTASGASALDRNTQERPTAVTIVTSTWPAEAGAIVVPPHSFTLLIVPVDGARTGG